MSTLITLPGGAVVEVPDETLDVGDVAIHQHQAFAHTIERWRKPVFLAVQKSWGPELQEVENALWGVMLSRFVDFAAGYSLDKLGALVGEARNGKNDARFRVRVQARIRINASFGTVADIIAVLKLLNPELTPVVQEHYPAAISIDLGGVPSSTGTWEEIADLLRDTRAAGVGGTISIPTRVNSWRFNQDGRAWGFDGSLTIGGMLTDGRSL